MSEIVFVVEMHQNASDRQWHTRIDEEKYNEFFKRISECIIDRIPNAVVMKNMIPKWYLDYDIYNNLV